VVAVTYDSVEVLARFAKRRRITYPLLADSNSEVIRAFGLLDEAYAPGSYAHGIAHPIVIVVDADGIVTRRFSSSGYTHQPDVGQVIAELRKNGDS
jgi:peroxiredoxin